MFNLVKFYLVDFEIVGQFDVLALFDLANAPVKALAKGLLDARGDDLGRFDDCLLGQSLALPLELA